MRCDRVINEIFLLQLLNTVLKGINIKNGFFTLKIVAISCKHSPASAPENLKYSNYLSLIQNIL